MTTSKQLFIHAIKLAELDGQAIIPTALTYDRGVARTGADVIAESKTPDFLHDNFKLELGGIDPRTKERRSVTTATGERKSAVALTKDFVDATLKKLDAWLLGQDLDRAKRILVAEPIAMGEGDGVEGTWLTNYRYHLKRILERHFDEVDFLPEPFAVFQYYRYGVKHSLITKESKHIALVCDFGGGTFDVSVIETTAKGDISQSGRNSRPLSSSSVPVGGAYFDRQVARSLIHKQLAKGVDSRRVQQAANTYEDWITGKSERPDTHPADAANFIRHYKRLLCQVERAKISICTKVRNWNLNAEHSFSLAAHVSVPTNPLREHSDVVEARIDPHVLREIFERVVWKDRLMGTIRDAIQRAREALAGQPIGLILLSGGSANVGWFKKLIERDLRADLPEADILELQENFKEIVAKGLAIECARRSFREGEGDFNAVMYNPLHLYAAANGDEREAPTFRSVIRRMNPDARPSVLLPSASELAKHIDAPIRWKFKLSHAPKGQLDYYFTRCEWDGHQAESLYNIDHRIITPKGMPFGANIWVELVVREDATVVPRFIYQAATPEVEERAVDGRPFALDMTLLGTTGPSEAYVGFDFGSTNSAYSFVERSAITAFTARGRDKGWLDLESLLNDLPYPVANAFKRFVAETNQDRFAPRALAAMEAALAYAAYVSYMETCALDDRRVTAMFKGLAHRSAGPLWKLFKDAQRRLDKRARISKELRALLLDEQECFALINQAVDDVAKFKHEKSAAIDYRRVLTTIGNAIRRSLVGRAFGSFENVRKKSFSPAFEGEFRIAAGPHLPFVQVIGYEGSQSFSDEELYLIDIEEGTALPMFPLMFWSSARANQKFESPDLFLFDCLDGKGSEAFSFKASASTEVLLARQGGDFSLLAESLRRIRCQDEHIQTVSNLMFDARKNAN